MSWRLVGPKDLTTSPALSMDPDGKRLPDDDVHVPAAAPSQIARSMMRLMDKAQKAADGSAPAQVCDLRVLFSLDGDADVVWDLHTTSNEPAP